MANMVRKQVYIEARQERSLKALAKRQGVTEAELIRRFLDRGLAGSERLPPDDRAWLRVERFIAERVRAAPASATPHKRRWTRDELYDD